MFTLGTLFQFSYVTGDLDVGADYLTNTLGARQLSRFDDLHSPDGTKSAIHHLAHFVLGELEVELIEPRRPWTGSIYLDALPPDGQAVAFHHVGFLTESRAAWRRLLAEAAALGYAVPARGERPTVCYAYLDTRARSGHFTEVVFREPGIGPGGVTSR